MNVSIQSIKPLKDLPNEHGFKFVGITRNFMQVPCFVVQHTDGNHYIQGAAFSDLTGWVRSWE